MGFVFTGTNCDATTFFSIDGFPDPRPLSVAAADWSDYMTLRGVSLKWPALGIAALVVIVVAWIIVARTTRDGGEKGEAMNVWTLDDDMSGAAADSRYHRWVTAGRFGVILLACVALVACALAARPVMIRTDNAQATHRDIVLCLDVSGSTLPYDEQILTTYANLVDHFHGERIGLSIFNSSSRTVFPLTDDYELVKDQLDKGAQVLEPISSTFGILGMSDQEYQDLLDWLEGTENVTDGASLIGDGLVSCAIMLPEFILNSSREVTAHQNSEQTTQDDARSGMILLATDNEVNGDQVYTLSEALDLTQQSNIAVDALYAGADPNGSRAREMSALITSGGGIYEVATSSSAVSNLVRDIDSRTQAREEDQDRADVRDAPGMFLLLLAILWAAYMLVEGVLRR